MDRLGADRVLDGYRRYVAMLSGAFFLLCLTWATSAPYLDGPDELVHHNSVARIVDGGGWPRPYEAPVLPSTRQSALEARAIRPKGGVEPLASPSERSRLLDPGSLTVRKQDRDQMVQHPPAFYGLTAGVLMLAGGDHLRWDVAAMLMRVVSAGLLTVSLPYMIGCVSRITRDQLAGIVGGTAIVGIPFFSNMGGYVSNDNLLVAATAAALYGAVRLATSRCPPKWLPLDIGAALGIALLSKGYAFAAIPAVVALSVVAIARRPLGERPGLANRLGIAGILAFAIGGWWWVRNLLVLGKLQPSVLASYSYGDAAHREYSFSRFVTGSADRLQSTFWGRGYRPEAAFPSSWSWTATVVLLALVVSGLLLARRRVETLILLTVPLLAAGIFLTNAHRIFRVIAESHYRIRGVQGRYLFVGLIAVAVCVGWVAVAVGRTIDGLVVRRGMVPAIVLAPWILALSGLYWTVSNDVVREDRAIPARDLQNWIGLSVPWLLALSVLALVSWVAWSISEELHWRSDQRPSRKRVLGMRSAPTVSKADLGSS